MQPVQKFMFLQTISGNIEILKAHRHAATGIHRSAVAAANIACLASQALVLGASRRRRGCTAQRTRSASQRTATANRVGLALEASRHPPGRHQKPSDLCRFFANRVPDGSASSYFRTGQSPKFATGALLSKQPLAYDHHWAGIINKFWRREPRPPDSVAHVDPIHRHGEVLRLGT